MHQKTTNLKIRLEQFIKEEYSDLKYKYNSEHFANIIDTSLSQITQSTISSIENYLQTNPFTKTEIVNEIEQINLKITSNNFLAWGVSTNKEVETPAVGEELPSAQPTEVVTPTVEVSPVEEAPKDEMTLLKEQNALLIARLNEIQEQVNKGKA